MNTLPKDLVGNLVSEVRTWNPTSSGEKKFFTYIDISSVSRETKDIEQTQDIFPSDAPSRARQIVEEGDVLVSTVRPNLNAVAIIENGYAGATASTGFCVLRPRKDRLCPRFLYHWVRSPAFVRDMIAKATGATYPAVSDKIIKESTIPSPPLPEQRRIAAILDKADSIRRKREESIRLTEELLRSTFLEMFGDPATNPNRWATHPLQELVSEERPITYGILKPGPDTEGGIPYIRVVDIKNQRIAVDSVRRTTKEIAHEYRRSTLQPGDILLSIRGHVGRCAVVPRDLAGANITQDTARICARHEWSRAYLFWSLHINSIQNWMEKHVRGVAVKGINLGDVKRLPLPLPPKDLCLKFDKIQAIANQQHDNRARASEAAKSLFGSLVQRAFRGDL
jgi:type I restriction enzyme S subunit